MQRKRQLKTLIQEKGFEKYEEEISVVEVDKSKLSLIQDDSKESKRYVLTEHTGLKFILNDSEGLREIIDKSNIKEIIVEELTSGSAKRQSIAIENSLDHKKTVKKAQLELIKNKEPKEESLALRCERILNQNKNTETVFKSIKQVEKKESKQELLYLRQRLSKVPSKENAKFFKVKNNSELFKIGKSFLSDYKEGKRCFGFSSGGNVDGMIRSLFGIAIFFNYYNHTNVLMFVSDNELKDLQKLGNFSNKKTIHDIVLDVEYEIWESQGISVISYSSLIKSNKSKAYDLIDKLTKEAGVSLCSLPKVEDIDKQIDLYFQILQRVDNLSLIVKKNNSKINKVQTLIETLKNYKVKIKGVLIASS
jgi:hypothetical protein